MIFKTLKEKCEYYRSLTDYKLTPNGYTLVMIDGKNFSTLIKNKFEKPFDNWFTSTMTSTAKYLCGKIQGCVGAFVQSDEISLVIKDDGETCPPFNLRMCKLLSIIPALATSYFTKNIISYFVRNEHLTHEEILELNDYVFDCKVWNVPNENDVMAWLLYRQIDCVRNSKQQFCQTYLPHSKLKGLNTDEQVELCKNDANFDWNYVSDGNKYGRFITKVEMEREINGQKCIRGIWIDTPLDITQENNRVELYNLLKL